MIAQKFAPTGFFPKGKPVKCALRAAGGGDEPAPPAAPTGLVATPGDGEVGLVWDSELGVVWDAYVGTTAVFADMVVQGVDLNAPNIAVGPLTNGVTYYFAVVAKADGQESDPAITSSAPEAGPGGTDPDFASVLLLLHMDSAFNDSSAYHREPTVVGSPTIVAESVFGGGAGLFSAGAGYVQFPNAAGQIGSGDFTLQWRYRWPSVADTYGPIFDYGYIGSGALLIQDNAGSRQLSVFMSGAQVLLEADAAPSVDVWYDYALVRAGGTLKLYRDTVEKGSVSNNTDINQGSSALSIGARADGAYGATGHLDEVRLSLVARDVSSTAVAPFPNS